MTQPAHDATGQTSRTYLTNIANAFDPVESDVHFDAASWTRIRNAIYDLTSVQCSANAMPWQPIATAPKDRNILLSNGKEVSEGGWLSSVEQGGEFEGDPAPGWWSVTISYKRIEEIMHWMPLPEPALTGADAQREGHPAAASIQSAIERRLEGQTIEQWAERAKISERNLSEWIMEHSEPMPYGIGDNAKHVHTDKCGFDRSSSISEDRYVCDCGWRDV